METIQNFNSLDKLDLIKKTGIVVELPESNAKTLNCSFVDCQCEDDDGRCCDFGD